MKVLRTGKHEEDLSEQSPTTTNTTAGQFDDAVCIVYYIALKFEVKKCLAFQTLLHERGVCLMISLK